MLVETKPDRCRQLRLWWSVAGVCLFATTWKLWTPQTEFPQIPLLAFAVAAPLWLDWLGLGGTVVGLLVAGACELRRSASAVRWRFVRLGWWMVILGLSGLWVLDQHRLQPWAWQLWLLAFLFGSGSGSPDDSAERLKWMRRLTISIYFWSAVSKLDALFPATHGPTLVAALLRVCGFQFAALPGSVRWWMALGLPVFELAVALCLISRRSQRIGLWGATALHVGLLIALGPWGLNHSLGVLAWNAIFIGHGWWLFGSPDEVAMAERSRPAKRSMISTLALRGLLLFAIVWPVGQPFGWCDHWLAWSVYSARTSQVSVALSAEGIAQIPESARPLIEEGELRLDRWSLSALNVPIYPERRFQEGCVESLQRTIGSENLLEIIVMEPTSRWSPDWKWQRSSVTSSGQSKAKLRLNTLPRDL